MANIQGDRVIEQLPIALPIVVEQLQSYELYTNKAFKNGTDARAVLTKSLLDKSKADREKAVALIREGTPREEAVRQFVTEENFHQWLTDLKESLEDAVR